MLVYILKTVIFGAFNYENAERSRILNATEKRINNNCEQYVRNLFKKLRFNDQ